MSNHIELTKQHAAEWKAIDWTTHQKHVKHLQERIFCVTRNQKWKQVKNLQKLLVRSYSAHVIAVRKVTQEKEMGTVSLRIGHEKTYKGRHGDMLWVFRARATCEETRTRGSKKRKGIAISPPYLTF